MTDHDPIIKSLPFAHNRQPWWAVFINGYWFAKDDRGSLTGPYDTPYGVYGFVKGLKP